MIKIKSMSEIREAKDGRKFYVLGAVDAEDIFANRIIKRTVFQQFTEKSDPSKQMNDTNPQWVGGDPSVVEKVLKSGKAVPGEVVTKEVPEYEIPGTDRKATSYSTIVFKSENYRTVFKNAGHNLDESVEQPELAAQAAESELV